MSTSLGLIETVGLSAAITAADTAVKSANVRLLGYEITKGGGLVTVKFVGDVGAVNAALEAAVAAASNVSKVYSKLVIPRPNEQLHKFLEQGNMQQAAKEEVATDELIDEDPKEDSPEAQGSTDETSVGNTDTLIETQEITEEKSSEPVETNQESKIADTKDKKKELQQIEDTLFKSSAEVLIDEQITTQPKEVCNLCRDPECPRQKGDLRTQCIHYKK